MTELVEGEFGTCRVCGSPLLGAMLTIHGVTSHYCPECNRWMPPPLWKDEESRRDWRDEMRERFEIASGPKKIP